MFTGINQKVFIRNIFIFRTKEISLHTFNMSFRSNKKRILCGNPFCVSSVKLITEMCSWSGNNCYCNTYIPFTFSQRISTLQNSNTFCYVLLVCVYAAFSSQESLQFTHLSNSTYLAPRNVCETKIGWKVKGLRIIYLLHSLPQLQFPRYAWGTSLVLHRLLTRSLNLVFFLLRFV